jgi:hypothetical protein
MNGQKIPDDLVEPPDGLRCDICAKRVDPVRDKTLEIKDRKIYHRACLKEARADKGTVRPRGA